MTSPLGGLRGFVTAARELRAAGRPAAVAVVLSTRGSTYRKRGALVLVDEVGVRFGAMSGGCLEPELERRARLVLASGRAEPVAFDTRDRADEVFGTGLGCRGRVDAVLLPLPCSSPANLLVALERAQDDDRRLDVRLSLREESLGAGEAAAGDVRWSWNANGFDETTVPPPDDEDAQLSISAPPRVLLLGAGPETPALIAFARLLGWFVTVVEPRGRWSAPALDAGADVLLPLAPDAAFEALAGARADAAVVMSHSIETDLGHLRAWARSALPFVGLVGPAARREALLTEIGTDADALRPRLHGPVGLPLGGDGPESIALSIVAQLQRQFAGGRGD